MPVVDVHFLFHSSGAPDARDDTTVATDDPPRVHAGLEPTLVDSAQCEVSYSIACGDMLHDIGREMQICFCIGNAGLGGDVEVASWFYVPHRDTPNRRTLAFLVLYNQLGPLQKRKPSDGLTDQGDAYLIGSTSTSSCSNRRSDMAMAGTTRCMFGLKIPDAVRMVLHHPEWYYDTDIFKI